MSIEDFLARHEASGLLRFSTAGSVDDGKSTLIGRLLYDSKSVYEDQMKSVAESRLNRSTGPIDFSLLTDGLKAEREQGITIDVAYRYFSTPKRKFIIADTPGHEQYTRNMATGASTAELAIILIDARKGLLPQSRRHSYISWLLGIPRIAVAINKMDLVEFSENVFRDIEKQFLAFAGNLGFDEICFLPISALDGDNVVARSQRTPWYSGPPLLEYLESVPLAAGRNLEDLRLPVQYVIRPDLDFRGFAGTLASGSLKPGDPVMALPSGRTSRVKSVVSFEGELAVAFAPMAVNVTLEDEIDVSRGDMLVNPLRVPHISRRFEASVVWMSDRPLEQNQPYLLKHTSHQVSAVITRVTHRVDINTLAGEASASLGLNEIGVVEIEATHPLYFDPYRRNRSTGSFILIDPITNATLAAGMIREPGAAAGGPKRKLTFNTGRVTPAERFGRTGHLPATIWLTARADLAWLLERRLYDRGCLVQALADDIESHLLPDLARVMNQAGLIVICSSPESAPEDAIAFEPSQLSPKDPEAADQIVAELTARGIFLPSDFSSGEGI